jgi:L-amino acid N-acyltransferase YncA
MRSHTLWQIGVLSEVGFKFGRYHDTAWLERRLSTSLSQTGHD